MKFSRIENQRRLKHFEETCRKAGFKLTHQRREIFREVVKNREHPDAEAVYRAVRRRIPSVSRDTVYRTLWMLTDLELINVLGASKDRVRFDANLDPHHHFVCSKCGFTRDFQSPELDDLPIPVSIKDLGSIRNVQVEVRGVCVSCEARKRSFKNTIQKEKP